MIRPALETWRKVTDSLLLVSDHFADELRDEAIEKIDKLLDVRDQLQPEIVAPFTPEEEAYGKELVELEKKVQAKLAVFNKQIRTDITDAQSKKDTIKNYVNPYSNVAQDGTFYDKKQ